MHLPSFLVVYVAMFIVMAVLSGVLAVYGRRTRRKELSSLIGVAALHGWRYDPGPRDEIAARYRYGPFGPVGALDQRCQNLLYGTFGARPMMLLEVERNGRRNPTHTSVAALRLPMWRPFMTISPRMFGSRGAAGPPMQRFLAAYKVETSYPAFRAAFLTDQVIATLLAGPPIELMFFRDELLCWQTRTRLSGPWIDAILPIASRLADHALAI